MNPPSMGQPTEATVTAVRRIGDRAPHNAFTDLARHRDRWFCVFREGGTHVSADGTIRVLVSPDARHWASAALLARDGTDLRDPRLVTRP
ncbi:exo-alpha-sialidase, partial [Micromonospora azadirachtae]